MVDLLSFQFSSKDAVAGAVGVVGVGGSVATFHGSPASIPEQGDGIGTTAFWWFLAVAAIAIAAAVVLVMMIVLVIIAGEIDGIDARRTLVGVLRSALAREHGLHASQERAASLVLARVDNDGRRRIIGSVCVCIGIGVAVTVAP